MNGAADPCGGQQASLTSSLSTRCCSRISQISVFVFEDNAPSTVRRMPRGAGVSVVRLGGAVLFEAGGTYGASGGRDVHHYLRQPAGTEYALNADGSPRYNRC